MTDENFSGRHEIKLLISYSEYLMLSSRLNAVLHRDVHSKDDGYFIRSLYFDDTADNSYYEKLNGLNERKKYRIRCYDFNPDYITLECKEKRGKFVNKTSAVLSPEECKALIDGDFHILEEREETVCKEVYAAALTKGLHNAVIVDYSREAFVYPASNVRITFDRGLHACGFESFDIFDKDIVSVPIYFNNSVILEIKYDSYIPSFIRGLIPPYTGVPVSVSKYCLCREIEKRVHI